MMNQLIHSPSRTVSERQDVSTDMAVSSKDMAVYFEFLRDNLATIWLTALFCIVAGIVYVIAVTPTYESNITIQIEERPEITKNNGADLLTPVDQKAGAAAEMELLRSRLIVSRAVENTRLYITVAPNYFPGFGAWIARHNRDLSEPGLFGHGGYAWGSEHAEISRFDVPDMLEGKPFTLTAMEGGDYQLAHDGITVIAHGRVGQELTADTKMGRITIAVDQLSARKGAEFTVTRLNKTEAVAGLQRALSISERGKQSGIIGVSLQGPDPILTSSVLREISQEYIRQNIGHKSEEAEKSLAFLNRELPDVKNQLEKLETRYNQVRNKSGMFDLSEESKSLMQETTTSRIKLIDLQQRREEMLVRFTSDHPVVETLDRQIRSLNRSLAAAEEKIKKLPSVEQEILRLSRDVKVHTELYSTLLSTAQQLRLATASKVGNVRLIDSPVTAVKPIRPKPFETVALAAIVGLLVGALVAYFKNATLRRINNAEEIRRSLGLTVSASIPWHGKRPHILSRFRDVRGRPTLLPQDDPSDGAVESLRSLRSLLQYSIHDMRGKVVMITSPTPGAGKSFIAANLATLLASAGKRVLLIDGDLQAGHLHRYFEVAREPGLSEAIMGAVPEDSAVRKSVTPNLDMLPTGTLSSKPAELLAQQPFSNLVKRLSARYDFVLIDSAPVLTVADGLAIAPNASLIFNVVRARTSSIGELEEAIELLHQTGDAPVGVVLNGLKPRSGRYGSSAARRYALRAMQASRSSTSCQ